MMTSPLRGNATTNAEIATMMTRPLRGNATTKTRRMHEEEWLFSSRLRGPRPGCHGRHGSSCRGEMPQAIDSPLRARYNRTMASETTQEMDGREMESAGGPG